MKWTFLAWPSHDQSLGPAGCRVQPAVAGWRRRFGIEAARIILTHRSTASTEAYADKDENQALEAAMRLG